MTISTRIRSELFLTQTSEQFKPTTNPQLIRLPLTRPPDVPSTSKKKSKKKAIVKCTFKSESPHRHGLAWTTDEHDRFLQGLERYPSGPWKAVAAFVGTRTPRQTMTHAQKYRQKIQRRRRGLMTSSRQPVAHSVDAYCGLVISTTCSQTVMEETASPIAVDTSQVLPLESNWFDKVQVDELDAAFLAFLEVYDPTMDEKEHVFCNISTGASIVL